MNSQISLDRVSASGIVSGRGGAIGSNAGARTAVTTGKGGKFAGGGKGAKKK